MGTLTKNYVITDRSEEEVVKWFQSQREQEGYDKAKQSFDRTNSGHRKKLYKYKKQNDGIKWLVLAGCAS